MEGLGAAWERQVSPQAWAQLLLLAGPRGQAQAFRYQVQAAAHLWSPCWPRLHLAEGMPVST